MPRMQILDQIAPGCPPTESDQISNATYGKIKTGELALFDARVPNRF
jgi:hypothetical protein